MKLIEVGQEVDGEIEIGAKKAFIFDTHTHTNYIHIFIYLYIAA